MAKVASHSCPNCGGELAIPVQHERLFRCESCGSALEDEAFNAGSTADIRLTIASAPTIDLSSLTSYAGPVAKAARRGISIVVSVVVLLTVIGAFVGYRALSDGIDSARDAFRGEVSVGDGDPGGSGLDAYGFATSAIVNTDDETGPDLAAVTNTADGFELTYLDFDAADPVRWATPVGAESVNAFDPVIASPTFLFLNVGDTVVAHNRKSGAKAFTIQLSDVIQHSICLDCVRIMGPNGDTLVTLTADGMLSGWNATDGAAKWTVRLTVAARQIVDFGGSAAVVEEDPGADAVVRVFDVGTGAPTANLAAACPDTTFGGTDPIGIYDQLTPVSPTAFVWVATHPIAGCAQRWDVGSPTPTWTSVLPEGGSNIPYDAENFAVSATAVHVVQGDSVQSFALSDGARREIVIPDVELEPLGADDATLVLAGVTTRGTAKSTIQAVDLTTGNVRWTFAPEDEPIDSFGRMFVTSSGWVASLVPDGLAVLQYRDQDETIVLQTIPLASGTASAPVTLDVDSGRTVDRPTFFGFRADTAFLAAGTHIIGVGTSTGDVLFAGP